MLFGLYFNFQRVIGSLGKCYSFRNLGLNIRKEAQMQVYKSYHGKVRT